MPLPFTARQKLFRFLSTSVIVAKIAYALKISFIFIAVLFVDAVQRMLRVSAEGQQAKQAAGATDVRTETNYAAKKFYTQRNMYLTGFTLFLSHSHSHKTEGSPPTKDQAAEIAELKKKLAASEAQSRDFGKQKVHQKQAKQQAVEYDRLATELNKATGQVSNKKSD
ncbi:endoplasmic reticulum protein [Rhizoctonia solani]|uniref:Endoplasmic reticulum transmembrane protein n=1 Tax=Rhizoctonia solani TaxID=456999 RepID=A0A8H7IBW4_9AGAM|nr:endoplasmic reticulum protein [Rhizoctonia solani]